jgi:hydrogenase-4 component B
MSAFGLPATPLAISGGLCALGLVLCALGDDRRAPRVVAWLATAAALALLWASLLGLGGARFALQLWSLPLGRLQLALTPLGSLILLSAAIVYIPVSLFSGGYLARYRDHYSLRAFGVSYFALLAAIALVTLAHDVQSFFLAWEAMAILSTLLVAFERREDGNVRAAFWMLAIGEAGTLAALAGWLLIAGGGALDFDSLALHAPTLSGGLAWLVFALAFFGFAAKAGLVPVNPWLPRAHPAAPGNVSALLSAVILNLGVYGILVTNHWLAGGATAGMGLAMLVTGAITAIIGILYATIEDDLKRMLAFTSMEGIGLVIVALGAAMTFGALGLPGIVLLAQAAAFYHLVNHSASKALLFITSASVDAQAGSRDMNRLGGLLRAMPWTGAGFLVGALSMAALPPFAGFASEWLILQTLLRSVELQPVPVRIVFALVGAIVALTAALAVTCFAKAFSMTFLGLSRSEQPTPREAGRAQCASFAMLALVCILLGTLPAYIVPGLAAANGLQASAATASLLVPPFFEPIAPSGQAALPPQFVADFHSLGAQAGKAFVPGRGLVIMLRGSKKNPVIFAMSTTYFVLVFLAGLLLVRLILSRLPSRARRAQPWDGGLPRLSPELTYTATGFSNPVRVVFAGIFQSSVEERREAIVEHFRSAIRLTREETYFVDRVFVKPVVDLTRAIARALARLHHGRLNAYVAYVLGALIVTMVVALLLARAKPG